MKQRQVPIALPSLGQEEWEATRDCFESGWLTQGPKVAAFEAAFAKRHGVKHALAVSSCTTGLHLALSVLGIGPGDEVIVPAFTWVATANAVLYCGGTPVFVDINRGTFNLDPKQIADRITPKTRAVLVVHLFGLCVDMDAIRAIVPCHIPIVEDAACAAGAAYKGKSAGALGEVGVFSFHPRKAITTGEGGMITTNNDALADACNQMRNHGASLSEEQRHQGPRPYLLPDFNVLGYNYRMTDIQGAIGLVQMGKLNRFIEERQRWSQFYTERLRHLDWLRTPESPQEMLHVWQSYVCFVDPTCAPLPRNEIMDALQKKGISTRPGTHAVHKLNYYLGRFGLRPEDFPEACLCERQTLSLPLHNQMILEDYEYVVESLQEISRRSSNRLKQDTPCVA